MSSNMALIPARGRSKRIPGKNIRNFAGKPIIAWSIEAALSSRCFQQVVVSTDSEEIAEVAIAYGASIPFMRPDALADDYTGMRPVIKHALQEMQQAGAEVDKLCCILPTAPLLQSTFISEALFRMESENLDFIFSASAFDYPVQRGFTINESGKAERLFAEHQQTRSQDLAPVYHDAGQFYWGRRQAFLNDIDAMAEQSRPFLLPPHLVQDIDTPTDWEHAELLFELMQTRRQRQ